MPRCRVLSPRSWRSGSPCDRLLPMKLYSIAKRFRIDSPDKFCLSGHDPAECYGLTAGKDGIIKHVMSGINPQGCEVHSFKQPSAEELQHDFLWRVAQRLPTNGRIGIFNRSHYEEVLTVRVHKELLAREKLPK